MKRFHFPLKSLLVVREARDLQARERFSHALSEVAAAARALELIRAEKSEFETIMLDERRGSFRPADQATFLQAHRRLIVRESDAVTALGKTRIACDARRAEWLEARRNLRLIEKLKDTARQAHRRAEDRETQHLLDDRTNALVARRAA